MMKKQKSIQKGLIYWSVLGLSALLLTACGKSASEGTVINLNLLPCEAPYAVKPLNIDVKRDDADRPKLIWTDESSSEEEFMIERRINGLAVATKVFINVSNSYINGAAPTGNIVIGDDLELTEEVIDYPAEYVGEFKVIASSAKDAESFVDESNLITDRIYEYRVTTIMGDNCEQVSETIAVKAR